MSRIGFIGLGNIGGRLVPRLLAAGHEVVVFDLDQDAVARATAAGGLAAIDVPAMVGDVEAVFLSLPTPAIVSAVMDDVLSAAASGLLVVDHSTIDPGTARQLADRASKSGVGFLDAPVSGGVQGAEAGTLAVMVGGSAEDLERARPYLDGYSAKIFHVGAAGSGQAVKLANNQVTAAIIVALGEGLSTAVAAGVELETAAAVLTAGSAGNNVLSGYFPRTLFTAERPTGFALDFMHKDLGLFLESARTAGLPVPVTSLVRDLFSIGQRDGRGAKDFTSVVELYEDFTGVRLQTSSADRAEVAR